MLDSCSIVGMIRNFHNIRCMFGSHSMSSMIRYMFDMIRMFDMFGMSLDMLGIFGNYSMSNMMRYMFDMIRMFDMFGMSLDMLGIFDNYSMSSMMRCIFGMIRISDMSRNLHNICCMFDRHSMIDNYSMFDMLHILLHCSIPHPECLVFS